MEALTSRGLPGSVGYKVEVYPAGSIVSRSFPGRGQKVSPGVRGKIASFSAASRGRLRRSLVRFNWSDMVDRRRVVWATFTARDGSTQDFKKWLDTLRKRLLRRFPRMWFFWRLEFQERGRAHFHCIIVFPSDLAAAWAIGNIGKLWCDVVNASVELNAELVAQSVRLVHAVYGIAAYVSDASKVVQSKIPEFESPGRWWGLRGSWMSAVAIAVVFLSHVGFYEVRRLVRGLRRGRNKALRRKRRDRPMKDSVEFYDTGGCVGFLRSIG